MKEASCYKKTFGGLFMKSCYHHILGGHCMKTDIIGWLNLQKRLYMEYEGSLACKMIIKSRILVYKYGALLIRILIVIIIHKAINNLWECNNKC